MFTGCQDDLVEDTSGPDTQGSTSAQLLLLMGNVALNDGSHDNSIDQANCLEVVLPVTVTIGETAFTIAQESDYTTIETILTENIEDDLSLVFPISVIHVDHTIEEVASQEALTLLQQACLGENVPDQDIECLDFLYPLVFSTFDPDFQMISTRTVQDDVELLAFTSSISDNLVVSLNYPITTLLQDGGSVTVQSDQSLLDNLLDAVDSCDEDDDFDYSDLCELSEVNTSLQECFWEVASYNDENLLEHYIFDFRDNNDLDIYIFTNLTEGEWFTTEGDEGNILTFSGVETISPSIEGDWVIEQCSPTVMHITRGTDTIILNRNCFDGPIYCMANYYYELCESGPESVETIDLTIFNSDCNLTEVAISYHTTQEDAQEDVNSIANPEAYPTPSSSEIIWVRVSLLDDPDEFTLVFIDLQIIDCCDNPQDLVEDLVIYMPLAEYPIELISGHIQEVPNVFVADRGANSECAIGFHFDPFTVPVTPSNQTVQGDSFSLSLWFQMQNEDANDQETMFQKGTSNGEGFQLGVFDLNTPIFTVGSFSIWDIDWNNEVDVVWTNTDWHHLVVTVDMATNSVRMYRDGILRNEAFSNTLDVGDLPLDFYTLGQNYNGHLDDLRFYKTVLTTSEVQQLFNLYEDCHTCF